MTIGIGVLCEAFPDARAKCIVMATDTRGTFHSSTGLGPHDQTGKQFELPYRFAANIAGTVSVCAGIESELHARMLKIALPFAHDHVVQAITESQFYEFATRANHALMSELGVTLLEWKATSSPWLQVEGKKILRDVVLGMVITVAGFATSEPVLLEAVMNDKAEMQTFSVIGSGADAALGVLCRRRQEPYMTVQRTILHVAEALEAARLDAIRRDPSNPDVGNPGDYIILTPRAFRRLPTKDKTLSRLMRKFSGKDSEPLDWDDRTRKAFLDAMYFAGTTREEYKIGLRRPTFNKFVWLGNEIQCEGETLRRLREMGAALSAKPQDLQGWIEEPEPNATSA
jgi:hypothetical protein